MDRGQLGCALEGRRKECVCFNVTEWSEERFFSIDLGVAAHCPAGVFSSFCFCLYLLGGCFEICVCVCACICIFKEVESLRVRVSMN